MAQLPSQKERWLKIVRDAMEEREAAKNALLAEQLYEIEMGQKLDHEAEKQRCRELGASYWFSHWAWTYDPRVIGQRDEFGQPRSPYMQMTLWPKQVQCVDWIIERIRAQEPWGIRKSRDQGATYIMCGVALYQWLFEPGFKTTLTSGKGADFIDKIGNQDSVFEKLRIMVRRLPTWMLPEGFDFRKHDSVMRLINPETGALISGEPGDEAGRSGRSSLYLVDEAQILNNPSAIEAALAGNAECVGWIGTYHPTEGPSNFYARKIASLPAGQVFTLYWRDDPRKDDAWAEKKKASLLDPSVWPAEYEMDPDARSEDICIPSAWVRSAIELAKLEPRLKKSAQAVTGGDIGGGKAKSVAITRYGPVVPEDGVASRQEGDTTGTAYWLLKQAAKHNSKRVNFDSPGVGAGVASTLMLAGETREDGTLRRDGDLNEWDIPHDFVKRVQVEGVNTGDSPSEDMIWPDERTSKEMFANKKAEMAWLARTRFQRTHWHVLWLKGMDEGAEQDVESLISIPDNLELVSQLSVVKWGKNERGKIVIESKKALAKRGVPSPDFFDSFTLTMIEPDETVENFELDLTTFARENPWHIGSQAKSEFAA